MGFLGQTRHHASRLITSIMATCLLWGQGWAIIPDNTVTQAQDDSKPTLLYLLKHNDSAFSTPVLSTSIEDSQLDERYIARRFTPELGEEASSPHTRQWFDSPGVQRVSQATQSAGVKVDTPKIDAEASPAKITTNETLIKATPEDSNPESLYNFDGEEALTTKNTPATQTAMAEYYNDRMRALAGLKQMLTALAAQPTTSALDQARFQKLLKDATAEHNQFETAWFKHQIPKALAAYERSRSLLLTGLLDTAPEAQVEGRAIWLDRGTIVKTGSPDKLRALVRRLAGSGFNIIYFETLNASYPIYPSKILGQNPQIKGWDPLAVALDEAHKQGIELHAWVWCFAVGNTRHNRIIGKPLNYPGQILGKPELASEVLKGRNGEVVLPMQSEFWLSPASLKGRDFLRSVYREIMTSYPVDGLQLDYIRYPFQKPHTPMGYEPFAVERFTLETGLTLPGDDFTQKAWKAWKAFQVTAFVESVRRDMDGINPNLKLSAAVFPLARRGRMQMIHQDWETWVQNGWMDTLNPMAYSRSAGALEHLVDYVHNLGDDKTLVYPGLSLAKLNAIDLLDALEVCRQNGVMGTTLFATAQLDNDRQLVLQTGVYKNRKPTPPHKNPLAAGQQLIEETERMLAHMQSNPQILVDTNPLGSVTGGLSTLKTALQKLAQNPSLAEKRLMMSTARDEARAMSLDVDLWASTPTDPIARFQADMLKQQVDKLARLINYASVHLLPAETPTDNLAPSASPAPRSTPSEPPAPATVTPAIGRAP